MGKKRICTTLPSSLKKFIKKKCFVEFARSEIIFSDRDPFFLSIVTYFSVFKIIPKRMGYVNVSL